MSIPCANGPAETTAQSLIITCPKRTWMPSSCAPTTRTLSIFTRRALSTSIPFTPPSTVRFRISTPEARTTIPPRTTAPGLPWSTCWCVITIGPWWTPAPSVTTGGRVAKPTAPAARNSAPTKEAADAPVRPSSPPSSA